MANAAYSTAHRRETPVVSAQDARTHLEQLANAGIGARRAAELAHVDPSVVWNIRTGRLETLRPATSEKILAVRPIPAPGALVAATRAWRAIDSLQREGYTNREIAWHLGHRSQQLQLAPRRIRALTAAKIARLYERLAES